MHFQSSTPGWPEALLKMPDYSVVKSVDNPSLLREAKQRWAAAGRDPAKLWTIYRHFNVHTAPRSTWENALAHWRFMFARWVDATYLREYAPFVDFVSESNEYTSDSTWADPTEKFFALQNLRAAAHVWRNDYQGKTVHSADGGVSLIPESCKLALLAGTVSNDIPREVFEIALTFDYPIDYHAYTFYPGGVRAADDWANHSGRWDRHEREYGLKPRWLFGESGPYVDRGGGWRVCLGGDEAKLVAAMQAWWRDCAMTSAYREGRLIGAGCWFTSGGAALGWPDYELETPQLIKLADALRPLWRPGVLVPPVPPTQEIVLDISHHQPATSDLATAKAAGATGIIIRSCYGTQADSVAPLHIAHADAAGLPRGFYWYHLSRQHAQNQAALAFRVAGEWIGMQGFVDLEESTANDGAEPVFPRFSELYYNHINAALFKCDDLTGLSTGIYSRKGWLDWWFTLEQQRRWNFRPLWVASWTDGQPSLPVGWSALTRPYVLHQFKVTETWPGFSVRVDRNKTYPGLRAADILGGVVAPPQIGALTMAEKQEIEKHLDSIWLILWPKVKAKNPCGLYDAPNGSLLRTLTDGRTMDVFSKAGPWLLVTQAPNPIYWVRQQDVIQL